MHPHVPYPSPSPRMEGRRGRGVRGVEIVVLQFVLQAKASARYHAATGKAKLKVSVLQSEAVVVKVVG